MIFTDSILADFKTLIGHPELFFYSASNLFNKSITRTTIGKILFNSCNRMISDNYIQIVMPKMMKSVMEKNDAFDMVCVCDKELESVYRKKASVSESEHETKLNQLIESVHGFIIIQKGECVKYPNTYAVNLICSHKNKGKLLLTLALYALKVNTNVIDKRCVLELANGFMNAAGLCMYSKLGFVYDPVLKGDDCFEDLRNLPMIADLTMETEASIIAKYRTGTTNEKICNYRGPHQKWLGYLYDLQYLLDSNADLTTNKYKESANEEVSFLKLFEYCGNNRQTLDQIVQEIESNPNYDFNPINTFVQPVVPVLVPAPVPAPAPVIEKRVTRSRRESPSRELRSQVAREPVESRRRDRSRSRGKLGGRRPKTIKKRVPVN